MGHVTYTEQINAAPGQVWAILADVTRLPEWAYTEGRYPYPVEGRYGSEQTEGPGTIWVGVSADGQTATQKITLWEPPQRLEYELQEMENAAAPMSMTNKFALEAAGEGTQVTWEIDWNLSGGFSLSSLLIRFTGGGAFEEMMAGSLERLKAVVEKETQGQDGDTLDSA